MLILAEEKPTGGMILTKWFAQKLKITCRAVDLLDENNVDAVDHWLGYLNKFNAFNVAEPQESKQLGIQHKGKTCMLEVMQRG